MVHIEDLKSLFEDLDLLGSQLLLLLLVLLLRQRLYDLYHLLTEHLVLRGRAEQLRGDLGELQRVYL